ncbi:MAG TPA: acyl carrier protein [Vicinamibacterales bacterium]|nr:acyl carrier protein [Vicinamibacterales bacterium]
MAEIDDRRGGGTRRELLRQSIVFLGVVLTWACGLKSAKPPSSFPPLSDAQIVQVRRRLTLILAEQFEVGQDRVRDDARLKDDLDASDLELVEMIMAIEEEFAIEIPDADASKFVRVGDLVEYLRQNLLRLRRGK